MRESASYHRGGSAARVPPPSAPGPRAARGRAKIRKKQYRDIPFHRNVRVFGWKGGGNRRIPTGTHRTRGVRAYAAPSNIAHHDQACTMTSTLTHGSTNNAHRIAAIKAKQARNDQVGVPAAVALGLAYRAL